MSPLIKYRASWMATLMVVALFCLAAGAAMAQEAATPTPASDATTGQCQGARPPADTEPPVSEAGATTPGYDAETPTSEDGNTHAVPKLPLKRMGPPKGGHRISPKDDVWIHQDQGVVIVDGRVSLREGMLEMFACPRGTKEHESVVAVDAKAFIVHASLLNVGAEPGHPVRFDPEYQPASGTEIEIQVLWIDEKGSKHTARAQDWIRDVKTEKALAYPWVFAGSRFWHDKETHRDYYQAEGGEFICVSNFATAMLDLPIQSTQGNEELAFEAFTEQIPAFGTHVRLVLKPKLEKVKGRKDEG